MPGATTQTYDNGWVTFSVVRHAPSGRHAYVQKRDGCTRTVLHPGTPDPIGGPRPST